MSTTTTGTSPTTTRCVDRPVAERDPHLAAEIRAAARSLLLTPLLTDHLHPDELRLVRRHRDELVRTFADGLGYRLVVEPRAARLHKTSLGRDGSRPWTRRSGAPFTPRAYAMLALAVAALTRSKAQLLVDELVAQVRSCAVDARLEIDLDAVADRRALHAALTRLIDLGVLVEREGDLEHWAEQRTLSLLDVRRDVLALLVAAPLHGARSPDDLLTVRTLPSAAGGARIELRRRLVESPLLSADDLTEEQAEWWRRNRNRERDWFADRFDLELELRAEGAVVVDPAEELTDTEFPGRGSERHLALLLLAELVDHARTATGSGPWRALDPDVVHDRCRVLVARWGGALRRELREDPVRAQDAAIAVLTGAGLLRWTPDRALELHAAAARYAPRPALADRSDSGEASLFDTHVTDDDQDEDGR